MGQEPIGAPRVPSPQAGVAPRRDGVSAEADRTLRQGLTREFRTRCPVRFYDPHRLPLHQPTTGRRLGNLWRALVLPLRIKRTEKCKKSVPRSTHSLQVDRAPRWEAPEGTHQNWRCMMRGFSFSSSAEAVVGGLLALAILVVILA